MFEESLIHDTFLSLLSWYFYICFSSILFSNISRTALLNDALAFALYIGKESQLLEMFGISPTPTPPLAIDAASVVIDPKDLINGFSADEIFSSADCQGSFIATYSFTRFINLIILLYYFKV